MVAARILLVQFELGRHTLLAHEHHLAYAMSFGAGLVPVVKSDRKCQGWHAGYNTRLLREQNMHSLWDDKDAAQFRDELGLRVYTSRLLGRDKTLVLHGGGHTSVKVVQKT